MAIYTHAKRTGARRKKTGEGKNMTKTNERITVTTGGWDGTGYNGEGKARIAYLNAKGEKFIKARFRNIWSYLKVLETTHKVSGLLEAEYWRDCRDYE